MRIRPRRKSTAAAPALALGESLPGGGFSPEYAAERSRVSADYEARRNVEQLLSEIESAGTTAGSDDADEL